MNAKISVFVINVEAITYICYYINCINCMNVLTIDIEMEGVAFIEFSYLAKDIYFKTRRSS